MNKPILITGATSGIGQATTRALSSRGYDLFATYRDPRDRVAPAELPRVHPVQLDVTSIPALAISAANRLPLNPLSCSSASMRTASPVTRSVPI